MQMDQKCFYCSKDIISPGPTLSCQHKICYYCYARIPITTKFHSINNILYGKSSSSFKFTCKCLHGSGTFDVEKFITKTKASILQKTQHKCINHSDTISEIHCEKCHLFYCSSCFRDSECRHHINSPDIRTKCVNHNYNERDQYCQKCQTAICRVCKQLDHTNHEIIDFKEDMKEDKMKELQYKTIDDIKKSFDVIRSKALDSYKKIRNDKEKQYNTLIDKIEELKQKALILMESKKTNMMKTTELIMLTFQNLLLEAHFDLEQMYIIDKSMNLYLHDIKLVPEYDSNLSFIDSKINVYSPSITFGFNFIFKKTKMNCIQTIPFKNNIKAMIPYGNDRLVLALDNEIDFYNFSTAKDSCNEPSRSFYHKSTINCLLLMPDNILLSGSNDKTIKVWNLETNKELKTIEYSSEVTALCLLKDGQFASAGKNGEIRTWKKDYTEEIKIFTENDQEVKTLIYLSNHSLASAGVSEQIFIWNYGCFGEEKILYGHVKTITQLLELKDERIVSCSLDRTIMLWKDGECQRILEGHLDGVLSLYQMKDGRLISSSKDLHCLIWDLYTFESYAIVISIQPVTSIAEVTIQNNGKDIENYIITSLQDKSLKIWC